MQSKNEKLITISLELDKEESERNQPRLYVLIEDLGCGIPASERKKLGLGMVESTKGNGHMGVGFFIAKELARAVIDGELSIQNVRDSAGKITGARARLGLKIVQSEEEQQL